MLTTVPAIDKLLSGIMHLISSFLLESGVLPWVKAKPCPLVVTDSCASSGKGRICTNLRSSQCSIKNILSFLSEIDIQV